MEQTQLLSSKKQQLNSSNTRHCFHCCYLSLPMGYLSSLKVASALLQSGTAQGRHVQQHPEACYLGAAVYREAWHSVCRTMHNSVLQMNDSVFLGEIMILHIPLTYLGTL